MEVDRNTKMFSILIAAKIRVKRTKISTILHTISLNINNVTIHIQLIPLFTMEEGPSKAYLQEHQADSSMSAQQNQSK